MAEYEISTVLSVGNHLIAGSSNGTLMLWTGKNNKGSKIYNKVYEIIQSTNF